MYVHVHAGGEISSESLNMCESPTVHTTITQPSPPSSGPTEPASSTESGIIYWILSVVIIASVTCIVYMIITKPPAQQKQRNERQGKEGYIPLTRSNNLVTDGHSVQRFSGWLTESEFKISHMRTPTCLRTSHVATNSKYTTFYVHI